MSDWAASLADALGVGVSFPERPRRGRPRKDRAHIQAQLTQIVDLRIDGMAYADIAQQLEITRQQVANALMKARHSSVLPGDKHAAIESVKHQKKHRTPGRDEAIIAARVAGQNLAEIGKQHGISRERVRQLLVCFTQQKRLTPEQEAAIHDRSMAGRKTKGRVRLTERLSIGKHRIQLLAWLRQNRPFDLAEFLSLIDDPTPFEDLINGWPFTHTAEFARRIYEELHVRHIVREYFVCRCGATGVSSNKKQHGCCRLCAVVKQRQLAEKDPERARQRRKAANQRMKERNYLPPRTSHNYGSIAYKLFGRQPKLELLGPEHQRLLAEGRRKANMATLDREIEYLPKETNE